MVNLEHVPLDSPLRQPESRGIQASAKDHELTHAPLVRWWKPVKEDPVADDC